MSSRDARQQRQLFKQPAQVCYDPMLPGFQLPAPITESEAAIAKFQTMADKSYELIKR